MRAAVYNRYWPSFGGGERHAGKLAEVLASEGWEVELVGHGDVTPRALSSHLELELTDVGMRVIPDIGDEFVSRISADYDFFVSASYMSRITARARWNAYLCFFPTPFDHDLPAWRRLALRVAGRTLTRGLKPQMRYSVGWHHPERWLTRRWMWTKGDAIVWVGSGTQRVLRARFSRKDAAPVELAVRDESGAELDRFLVDGRFRTRRIDLGSKPDWRELHFMSSTTKDARHDSRDVGVAVSRLRVAAGSGWRRKVVEQLPWTLTDRRDLSFLDSYQCVMANSEFTRSWIRRFWKRDAEVLFPPVRVGELHSQEPKRPVILTVGRFFAPEMRHAKRQMEMVKTFADLVRSSDLNGWEFHLVGGCEPAQRPYLDEVMAMAEDMPSVHFHVNAPRSVVNDLLTSASIFWSATGLGQKTRRRPWTMEHFGITTVEAMAGGCVPVVFDGGGHREIVRDGVDGFLWSSLSERCDGTMRIVHDESLRSRLSDAARIRAEAFSDEAFAGRWREIAAANGLLP